MRHLGNKGFSITELTVVMGILALFSATAVSNINAVDRPLQNAAFHVSSYFRQVRAKALKKFNAHVKHHLSDHRPLWVQLDVT